MRALVLGAYGHFGKLICQHLLKIDNVSVIGAGHNRSKLLALGSELDIETIEADWRDHALAGLLKDMGIHLVIHAAGPFQTQDTSVAEACIEAGCYYADIADSRDFVKEIQALDDDARSVNVHIATGMGLTAVNCALIEHLDNFSKIDHINLGFSGSGRMPGLASIKSALSQCGKPTYQVEGGRLEAFTALSGRNMRHFSANFLRRDVVNLDAIDIDVLSERYKPSSLRYQGGLGLRGQRIMSFVSRCARNNWLPDLKPYAGIFRRAGSILEPLSGGKSALYIELEGRNKLDRKQSITAEIHALNHKGDLLVIAPLIAYVNKLMSNFVPEAGARVGVGLVSLHDILCAIADEEIRISIVRED